MRILTRLNEDEFDLNIPKSVLSFWDVKKSVLNETDYSAKIFPFEFNSVSISYSCHNFEDVSADLSQSGATCFLPLKMSHSNLVAYASLTQPQSADAHYVIGAKKDFKTPLVLPMKTADCVPVIVHFENDHIYATAVAHAGWRGYCSGITINSLELLLKELKVYASIDQNEFISKTKIFIAPAIFGATYECGQDVHDALMLHKTNLTKDYPKFNEFKDSYDSCCDVLGRHSHSGKVFPDLQFLNMIDALSFGLNVNNVVIHRENTYTHPHLSSYRRSKQNVRHWTLTHINYN